MIGLIWDKRGYPTYFKLLPKLGNSNVPEQQAVVTKFLSVFKNYITVVLADRDLLSPTRKVAQGAGIFFSLRLEKDKFVQVKPEI